MFDSLAVSVSKDGVYIFDSKILPFPSNQSYKICQTTMTLNKNSVYMIPDENIMIGALRNCVNFYRIEGRFG
jgi:hypothetical protein